MAQTLNEMLNNGIKEVDVLQSTGKKLASSVTTSQLRKFFGGLKRIDADFQNLQHETILLEPQLAYSVGRAKGDAKNGLRDLYESLSPLIREVGTDKKKFDNLVNIVEAIVAYHKFYNGKD